MFALLMTSMFSTAEAVDVFWDGHYRTQAHYYKSLSLSSSNDNAVDRLQTVQHWGSIKPSWILSQNVRLHSQLDMLYFQPFGTEAFTYQDPAWSNSNLEFADSLRPTTDGDTGLNNLMVSRLYGEVVSDIGLIRFGRMPVHWGSGMIFNSGDLPTQFVGDTADRIQYSNQVDSVFLLGAIEYRNEGFSTIADESIAGTFSIFYADERVTGGLYNVFANQRSAETSFNQYTIDGFIGADMGALKTELELGVQFGSGDLAGGLDEVKQLAFGGVLDAQLKMDDLDVGFNLGYASGDSDIDDKEFKQFTFDRNYDISLMLFDQIMPTLAPTVASSANQGLEYGAARVGNGISNALYAQPRVGYHVSDTFKPELRVLFARTAQLPETEAGNTNYGVEVNANLNYTPLDKFHLRAQLGYLFLGSYLTNYTDDELGGGFDENPYGAELNAIIKF